MRVSGRRLLGSGVAVATAALVCLAVVAGLRVRTARVRVNGLETIRQEAGRQVARLSAENEALRVQLEAVGAQTPGSAPPPPPRHPAGDLTELNQRRLEAEAAIKAATANLSDLQLRGQQWDEQANSAGAESRKLAEKETDLRKRLADAASVVQAMESELAGKERRLTPLELSSRGLRKARQTVLDAIDRQVAPARALEEVERRREGYLGSVLGRYRQLLDQSRFLSIRPENPAGANPAATLDLSRVQSVVSQAEEEHRQIQALNAQARLLIERMQKAR